MKRLIYLTIAALTTVAVACNKEPVSEDIEYGIDGKTPLPEAVDIGIYIDRHTIKWASFNLGASQPYQTGDFYAWGETEPKEDYRWENYRYQHVALPGEFILNASALTKYCTDSYYGYDGFKDDIRKLDNADDPVRKKLGNGWRMPTEKEVDALAKTLDSNVHTWKLVRIKGVRCYKITYEGNGKSIYLPLTGYMAGTDLIFQNEEGFFWSSEIEEGRTPSHAEALHIFKGNAYLSNISRSSGNPIRPVLVN